MRQLFKQTTLALTLLCSAQAADTEKTVAVTLYNPSEPITLDTHRDPSSIAHKKELIQILDLITTKPNAIDFSVCRRSSTFKARINLFHLVDPSERPQLASVSLTNNVTSATPTKYKIIGWCATNPSAVAGKDLHDTEMKDRYNQPMATIIAYLPMNETSASIKFSHNTLLAPAGQTKTVEPRKLFLSYVLTHLTPEPLAIIEFELDLEDRPATSKYSSLLAK